MDFRTISLCACVSGVSMVATPAFAQLLAGEKAPPITLEAVSNAGNTSSLRWDDYKGKTVVIEFWGTWCGPCVEQIPHLNEMVEKTKPRGDVEFLSVTFEDRETVDAFRERHEMRAAIGHDTDRSMVKAYDVPYWPYAYVVRDGVIVLAGHPQELSADRIAGVAESEDTSAMIASGREAAAATAERKTKATEARNTLLAEVESATVQLVVKPGDPSGHAGSGSQSTNGRVISLELTNQPIAAIIEAVWEAKVWQIEVGEWADDPRFDVIVKVPQRGSVTLADFRPLIAAGIGTKVESRERVATGYRVRSTPDNEKLRDEGGGMSMSRSSMPGRWVRINCTDATVGQILESAADAVGRRFEVPDELSEKFASCEVELPIGEPGECLERLSEALGVRFEEAEMTETYFVVSPM